MNENKITTQYDQYDILAQFNYILEIVIKCMHSSLFTHFCAWKLTHTRFNLAELTTCRASISHLF